jgi:hypothetical protein
MKHLTPVPIHPQAMVEVVMGAVVETAEIKN